MGCCGFKEKDPAPIGPYLQKEKERDMSISKVLLLGPGESGKSTLFKQMLQLYGKGFSDEDRKGYREAIHIDIITSIKLMNEYYEVFTEQKELKSRVGEAADTARQFLIKGQELTMESLPHLQAFWSDSAIQEVFNMGNRYHLNDSTTYYFDQIETICKSDYVPTFQDVVRCRIRTTGIVELAFQVEKHEFKLFDMGGQRNERKKWIHCFENVTAVIFVAALSSYDQMLIEDDRVNRMTEAINLFDDICNGRWFKRTAMMLFLNKKDVFAEKCARVPITIWNPDYTGKNDFLEAAEFIQKEFEKRNRQKKQIYTHLTCATATDNIKMVFNAIKDIIIRAGLKDIGLV